LSRLTKHQNVCSGTHAAPASQHLVSPCHHTPLPTIATGLLPPHPSTSSPLPPAAHAPICTLPPLVYAPTHAPTPLLSEYAHAPHPPPPLLACHTPTLSWLRSKSWLGLVTCLDIQIETEGSVAHSEVQRRGESKKNRIGSLGKTVYGGVDRRLNLELQVAPRSTIYMVVGGQHKHETLMASTAIPERKCTVGIR